MKWETVVVVAARTSSSPPWWVYPIVIVGFLLGVRWWFRSIDRATRARIDNAVANLRDLEADSRFGTVTRLVTKGVPGKIMQLSGRLVLTRTHFHVFTKYKSFAIARADLGRFRVRGGPGTLAFGATELPDTGGGLRFTMRVRDGAWWAERLAGAGMQQVSNDGPPP